MTIKISVNLPDDVLEDLKQVADERKVTLTQALKDAITLDKYVRTEVKRVLVEKEEGELKEIVLAR
jgi:predicted transcriptional regulator